MADFFLAVIKKISQIVILQNIRKYALIKTLKTGLKLPKIEILTPFYKISWKVDEIIINLHHTASQVTLSSHRDPAV